MDPCGEREREEGRKGRRETQFTCNLCSASVPAPVRSCPLTPSQLQNRSTMPLAFPSMDTRPLLVMTIVELAFLGITCPGGVPASIESDRGIHHRG